VLTRFAVERPHEELTRLVRQVLERLDQDGPEPDPTDERFLSFAQHADGSITGRFHLDPVGAQKFQAALEAHRQADRLAGDQRTTGQQQADALVQWADNTLAAGSAPLLRRVKPQVAVKIGSGDLADPATGRGAADLGFGGVTSAATARQVACDAELRRYLIDPDGELLDLGRSQRLVTRGLRKAVELRDEACVFAGCGAPAWVVRRPPRHPLALRRPDLPGQLGAALRTPPHPGPPRLPRRARYRRPMAHLPQRRHRDPHHPT